MATSRSSSTKRLYETNFREQMAANGGILYPIEMFLGNDSGIMEKNYDKHYFGFRHR